MFRLWEILNLFKKVNFDFLRVKRKTDSFPEFKRIVKVEEESK